VAFLITAVVFVIGLFFGHLLTKGAQIDADTRVDIALQSRQREVERQIAQLEQLKIVFQRIVEACQLAQKHREEVNAMIAEYLKDAKNRE